MTDVMHLVSNCCNTDSIDDCQCSNTKCTDQAVSVCVAIRAYLSRTRLTRQRFLSSSFSAYMNEDSIETAIRNEIAKRIVPFKAVCELRAK